MFTGLKWVQIGAFRMAVLSDQAMQVTYPFRKIWTLLGYYDVNKAKRSLYENCEINADYIIAKDGTKTVSFDQNEYDSDFLYLSEMGSDWCIMDGCIV